MKQTFTESVGGISPLSGGAIDGTPRPGARKPQAPRAPKPGVSVAHACPECDFVTTGAAEAARHLARLVTGNSECGIARSRPRAGRQRAVSLEVAAAAYLETIRNPGTAKAYRSTLNDLCGGLGGGVMVDQVQRGQLMAWFRDRWEGAAPATWNRHATAVRSFFGFCRDQGWADSLASSLIRMTPRPVVPARAPEAADVRRLIAGGPDLRSRTFWALLFDAAAKPGETLALNAENLDLTGRCAMVRSGVVSWTAETNRLLVALLDGRATGPVFLTERRARLPLPPEDIDAASGKARLSYRRAEELFQGATEAEPGGPWTLQQLRAAALAEAARDGADMPTLAAMSRLNSAHSIERYAYA